MTFGGSHRRCRECWTTSVLPDLSILEYQLDALAAALTSCHNSAVALCDRSQPYTPDCSEQVYFDALCLAQDITTIKLARTMQSLKRNIRVIMDEEGVHAFTRLRLESLLFELTCIEDFAHKSAHDFYAHPQHCLDEQASEGVLAVAGNLRITKDLVGSIAFP